MAELKKDQKPKKTRSKRLMPDQVPEYCRTERRASILAPFVRIIQDWVRQHNFSAIWIFKRLKQIGYTGGYDTVKSFVRPLKEQQARIAYSRFETMPGLQAQVDWADFKITEPSGRTSTVYLFLMLLGYCRAMYVEFVQCCTLESFLDCHKRAFHYLGGVPVEVLYDNMKHVVIRRDIGQVDFNIELLHFAHHCGFMPKAISPYSPWVKGKVERPVDYIRESFWRGYGFNSIEQANRDLFAWLDTVANTRVHGTHRQPIAERWHQEKASLGKLPASEYDTSLKIFRKVVIKCQISFEGNWYKVPHAAVGMMIQLKIKYGTIHFFDGHRLLASYPQAVGMYQLRPIHSSPLRALLLLNHIQKELHRLAGVLRGFSDRHRYPRPAAASLQSRQHQGPQLPVPAARLLNAEPGISKSKGTD
jgi:transposase